MLHLKPVQGSTMALGDNDHASISNPSQTAWDNVLAELQESKEGDEFKGLDRLASLDFVSDLLSSEGFESFNTPGPEEKKLTRLASLELLTELFEWEGGLGEGGLDTPLDKQAEEASGLSNDWTDEDLLAALEEGVAPGTEGESTGAKAEVIGNGLESGLESGLDSGWVFQSGGHGDIAPGHFLLDNAGQMPPKRATPERRSGVQSLERTNKQSEPRIEPKRQTLERNETATFTGLTKSASPRTNSQHSPPARQATSHAPRKIGRPMLPAVLPPQMENIDTGPRMRFSPQQQKALYGFGESIKWATPGLETDPRAHRLCAKIGVDIRQLKKWISNHRPKEHRPPVSHPPWSLRGGAFVTETQPPLSRAALASLAAAQAAVMGQPFPGPFDTLPSGHGPFPPMAPGQWCQDTPAGAFAPPFGGDFVNGGVFPPQLVEGYPLVGGHLGFAGGSGSSIGSQGSQSEAGLSSEPSAVRESAVAPDGVKHLLRRKLKDFEPEKVRKLFDLCMDYRKKRALLKSGATSLGAFEPPTKRPRIDIPAPPPLSGLVLPPPTPTSGPTQSPHHRTFPSGSSANSELTECEKPAAYDPVLNMEPTQAWQPSEEKLKESAPVDAAWGGGLEGRTLSTLPSFPSIDLSHWGLEDGKSTDHAAGNLGEGLQPGQDVSGLADQNGQTSQFAGCVVGGYSSQPVAELCESFPNPQRVTSGGFRPSSEGEKRGSAGGRERSGAERTHPEQRKVTAELPGCTFLFEKTLTMSDTNPLGRIIIPKVHAEAHLPKMAVKESCPLTVADADGKMWELRYSFWFNNKSRMYVLEHSGDFLQARGLAPGDSIAFYRADDGRLIIVDKKQAVPPPARLGSAGLAAASGFQPSRTFSGLSGALKTGEDTGSQKVQVDPLLLDELGSF